jgi:hypothetical protein
MELRFAEVAVLSALADGKGHTRSDTASKAAQLYGSVKFDKMLALNEVQGLISRRFIRVDAANLFLTYEGHSALLNALPVIENLRAVIGNSRYAMTVRR